jgi:asparagine synthetase B (glutamine-hydrolysing)
LAAWRGFFSALLRHKQDHEIIIGVDRRASVPIFYARSGNWLLFAPEVKALLAAPSLHMDVDVAAVATFLAQGHLLGDQTLFLSVRRLRGGQFLRIADGTVTLDTYWRFAPGSAAGGSSRDELERELGELVEASAIRHLGDPARTMIFLSGGADSRGILGGALTAVDGEGRRLNTITWGVDEGPADSDAAVAAAIARSVGTNHRFVHRQVCRYREDFARVNCLVDGLSEIAAYHPHEYEIMSSLRSEGIDRVLRGDEVFGWSVPATTYAGALSLVMLRRLRDAQGLGPVIRPEYLGPFLDGSDGAIESALAEVRDLEPNEAKDYLYFSHRLQCYLQTASSFRQVEMDQRNVLLDEPILDFLARVPATLRIDKRLYRLAMTGRYPQLARFPTAKRHNLEDWDSLLAADTPVRAFAMDEVGDCSSRIWEYFDPIALRASLEAIASSGRGKQAPRLRQRLKGALKHAISLTSPWLLSRIQSRTSNRRTYHVDPDQLILRILVLKHWHETFVRSAP